VSVALIERACHCSRVSEIKLVLTKLHRLLRARGRSTDDADDLIQEAFLRLQLYCRQHRVDKVEAFLVRTVLNLSNDLHRLRQRAATASRTLQTLNLMDSMPSADDVFASEERLRRMKMGLDRLSPRRREVFVLNRIEGYSFTQIAEQLGITLSAVEKHAAKAILQITDWMDDELEPPPGNRT
jgi:RNA polymerase sigma-70 factor (ECF subfamily)